jgi:hypothetical protein
MLVNNGTPCLTSGELVPVFWGDFEDSEVSLMESYLTGLAAYLKGDYDPKFISPGDFSPTVSQYGVEGAIIDPSIVIPQTPFWSRWVSFPFQLPAEAYQLQIGTNSLGELNIFAATNPLGVVFSVRRKHRPPSGHSHSLWTAWDSTSLGLTPDGTFVESIQLCSNQDGHLELFGIDGAGNLYHAWETGGNWNPWVSMMTGTDGLAFQSLTAVVAPNGLMMVFALTTQGQIVTINQTMAYDSTSWGRWQSVSMSNLNTATAISAAINSSQCVQLVAIDNNGLPWFTWCPLANSNYGFVPWAQLQGLNLPTPPAQTGIPLTSVVIGTNQDGHLEVFCMDAQNLLWHIWQIPALGVPIGSSWSDWSLLVSNDQSQGSFGGIMQLSANPTNAALELFFLSQGSDNVSRIFQQASSASDQWSPAGYTLDGNLIVQWANLGGPVGMYAVTSPGTLMSVCAVDVVSQQLWITSQAVGGVDWDAESGMANTIAQWQSAGVLPQPDTNQVILVFTKDIPLANFPTVYNAFHTYGAGPLGAPLGGATANLWAVIPLSEPLLGTLPVEVQSGEVEPPEYAWQLHACHEILESVTDPQPVTGWVMAGTNCEGADVCGGNPAPCNLQNFPPLNLPFGPVVGFWDNRLNTCSVFSTPL